MVHRVDCSAQDCGFAVESTDQDEVVAIVREHASEKHDMSLSEPDAMGMLEEA